MAKEEKKKPVSSITQLIESISPYYSNPDNKPKSYNLIYDSSTEALEPIYFFVLDLMNDFGLAPEKLLDTFASTPGGTHFSEIGMKATRMQEEAQKMLGSVNTVLRSVLNVLYDLRDFKIRLSHYEGLRSKKKGEREAAMLSLKQIWMDKVDIAKGNSSIKAMALGQAGYQTLIDAFLIVKDEDIKGGDGKELDLNDRIKRIVKARIIEFNYWLSNSEKELQKRYDIEKSYLKSQVSSLKLYIRWIKPYLQTAAQLEMKDNPTEAALVSIFNTVKLELTLLGKNEIKPGDLALAGEFPREFKQMAEKGKFKRKYYSCVLVDFTFRAIPRQGGIFSGRSEISLKGYALNEEEYKKLKQEWENSYLRDALTLIRGATDDSIEKMQEEIESYLEEDEPKDKKEKEKSNDQSNPFLALIGHYESSSPKSKDKKKDEKIDNVTPDSWVEKNYFRKKAVEDSDGKAFTLFDIYKKVHGMASFT